MRAWSVHAPGPIASGPLAPVEREDPVPGPGEVLVEVSACGVCRTDLHLAEGDLAPHLAGATPGHEVVGRVVDEAYAYALPPAPAGDLVPVALEALDRGGRLSIAGIHLSDIPPLRYQDHLFQERELVSVTANTRADGEAFLVIAARIGIHAETAPYAFDDVDRALADLAGDRVRGAAVVVR